MAKNFYRKHLGYLMAPKVGWPAALLFYLLFIAGLVVFAVRPGVLAGAPLKGLLLGAFLGLISYATYDLTNQATVKDWPLVVTVVDLVWGTTLGGLVSGVSVLARTGPAQALKLSGCPARRSTSPGCRRSPGGTRS